MAEIIQFSDYINVKTLRANTKKLEAGLIAPAKEAGGEEPVLEDHAADAIKSMADIEAISRYCIETGNYRNNMLFILGINFGLRVSDLRMLRFSNLINEDLMFKDRFPVFEKKTRNTRKKKQNRYITINKAVRDAVTLYLEHTPGVSLSDYMFQKEANRRNGKNEPLEARTINYIMEGLQKKLGLPWKMSSHTLRKTFGYWIMVQGGNDHRRLLLLQKIFGHSSALQTLTYIGASQDEMDAAYEALNLGGSAQHTLVDGNIIEVAG